MIRYLIALLVLCSTAFARTDIGHNPTYYVSPSGTDAPLATCENSTTPCKTLQYVRNALYTQYDLTMHTVTVQLMDGMHPPICNAGGCGPHMQHWDGLLGQTSADQFRIVGNCGNINAVVLQQAPPAPGWAVGQAAFDVSGSGAFTLRCVVIDGQGANQDQIAANAGGSIVLDRVTFRNATSVTNAANNISCDGTTINITGPLIFDGGNPQAGIYGSKGCSVYLNVNNVPGLLTFNFVNSPNYSLAAFLWVSSNAALNLQGLSTSGSLIGRFAVVKGTANIDLGATQLSSMPGTLPTIADGGSGGSLIEDARGVLTLWSIPPGIVSGTARSPRIECRSIVAGGAEGPNADCELVPKGTGAVKVLGPLQIQGKGGFSGTKTVYSYYGWCTLIYTSGVLTGGTC